MAESQVIFRQTILKVVVSYLLVVCMLFLGASLVQAAEPGLPFIEDFSNTNLKDETKNNANWLHGEDEA